TAPETFVLTNASGAWGFNPTPTGSYFIRTVVQPTWVLTAPGSGVYSGTLSANQRVDGLEFGVRQPPISIDGVLFNDANTNRARDGGEKALSGWTVFLDTNDNGVLNGGEQSTVTDSNGGYSFINLPPAVYKVRAVPKSGWVQTMPGSGPIPTERPVTVNGSVAKKEVNNAPRKYTDTEIVVALSGRVTRTQLAAKLNASSTARGRALIDAPRATILLNFNDRTLATVPLVKGANPLDAVAAFAGRSGVLWAQPNYIYGLEVDPRELTPDDPSYASQYHHTTMHNNQAWDITLGDASIKIAVTDDGVSLSHVDLSPNIWTNPGEIAGNSIDDDGNGYIDDVNGYDVNAHDNDPNPAGGDSHGTHVSGIAAARTNNAIGVAGTAGAATILPVRFYGTNTWTSTITAEAFKYAADNGARIISTSYNVDGFVGDSIYTNGIAYAYNAGTLHFNSAGNNTQLNPPRQVFEELLLVASTDNGDGVSSFSNWGYGVDIAAPGGNILSTVPGNSYANNSGTSMATPNAAGAAALIWSLHPNWTRDQVAAQLVGTGDNIDSINPSKAGLLGGGRVNSYRGVSESLAAPRFRSTTLPNEGAILSSAIATFTIDVANVFSAASVLSLSNYSLRGNGPDNTFYTADDNLLGLSLANSAYKVGTNRLTFNIAGTWVHDQYRFTAESGGLVDPFGTPLDGNGNGTGGDDFVRNFNFDPASVALTVSNTSSTADIGFYFAPREGSPSANDYYVRMDAGDTNVEIFEDVPTSGTPTFSIPKSWLSELVFHGNDGDDTLTVDYSNGNPVPDGGIEFDGAAPSASDSLIVLGSAGSDAVTFSTGTVTCLGTISYTNVETLNFDGQGGGDDVAVNSGLVVNMSSTQNFDSLSVLSTGSARMTPGLTLGVITNSVSIASGGLFDLADNDMIVDYDGASPLGSIEAMIALARNGGDWEGTGLTSDTAHDNALSNTSLGTMEASDFLDYYGAGTQFDGEDLNTTMVLVKYTYYGDTDFSGTVNLDDYANIDGGFLLHRTGWLNGDFDGSGGGPDLDDYSLIDAAFLTQGAAL
ncbi:MAG: S8 family serine peptidase, partial [Tepidisphaeraceae bacterium]